jgi:hypothetical protein
VQTFDIRVDTSPFIPVTGITLTSARSVAAGVDLPLTATVQGISGILTRTIIWTVDDPRNGTAEIINANTLKTLSTATGIITITATIIDGQAIGKPFTQSFEITVNAPAFEPVTGIKINETTLTQTITITITGGTPQTFTVEPGGATNKNITWTILTTTTPNVAGFDGNTLNTDLVTKSETITVRATITNGIAPTVDYWINFTIIINPPSS